MQSPLIIRPGLAVHCWALALLGISAIVAAISALTRPEENMLPLLLSLLLAGTGYCYWAARHRVVLTEETLSVSEPFRGTRSIRFADVDHFRYYEPGDRYGSEINLSPLIEVAPAGGETRDRIRIRLKPFSFRDSELLLLVLSEKCTRRTAG